MSCILQWNKYLFLYSRTGKTGWYPKAKAALPEGQRERKHQVCQERNPVTKNRKGRNHTLMTTHVLALFVTKRYVWCNSHFCVDQEKRATQKIQREAQVTLYRSYRVGDLPDIQIQYSSLIAPLQALAQVRTWLHSKYSFPLSNIFIYYMHVVLIIFVFFFDEPHLGRETPPSPSSCSAPCLLVYWLRWSNPGLLKRGREYWKIYFSTWTTSCKKAQHTSHRLLLVCKYVGRLFRPLVCDTNDFCQHIILVLTH